MLTWLVVWKLLCKVVYTAAIHVTFAIWSHGLACLNQGTRYGHASIATVIICIRIWLLFKFLLMMTPSTQKYSVNHIKCIKLSCFHVNGDYRVCIKTCSLIYIPYDDKILCILLMVQCLINFISMLQNLFIWLYASCSWNFYYLYWSEFVNLIILCTTSLHVMRACDLYINWLIPNEENLWMWHELMHGIHHCDIGINPSHAPNVVVE